MVSFTDDAKGRPLCFRYLIDCIWHGEPTTQILLSPRSTTAARNSFSTGTTPYLVPAARTISSLVLAMQATGAQASLPTASAPSMRPLSSAYSSNVVTIPPFWHVCSIRASFVLAAAMRLYDPMFPFLPQPITLLSISFMRSCLSI